MKARETNCPAEFTLAMIGGRWKIPLIFHLLPGAKRFSELARMLPGVTQKMLTQQLREMERNGHVERNVFAQVTPTDGREAPLCSLEPASIWPKWTAFRPRWKTRASAGVSATGSSPRKKLPTAKRSSAASTKATRAGSPPKKR